MNDVRLIRGEATEEEVAAVVAVLLTRPPAGTSAASRPASAWADRSAGHRGRRDPVPGPDRWRSSAWQG